MPPKVHDVGFLPKQILGALTGVLQYHHSYPGSWCPARAPGPVWTRWQSYQDDRQTSELSTGPLLSYYLLCCLTWYQDEITRSPVTPGSSSQLRGWGQTGDHSQTPCWHQHHGTDSQSLPPGCYPCRTSEILGCKPSLSGLHCSNARSRLSYGCSRNNNIWLWIIVWKWKRQSHCLNEVSHVQPEPGGIGRCWEDRRGTWGIFTFQLMRCAGWIGFVFSLPYLLFSAQPARPVRQIHLFNISLYTSNII